MAKLNFRVPRGFVSRKPGESIYSHGRRSEKLVEERCKEGGMDEVAVSARLPDGTVRVWGEAGGSRPPVSRRAYEDGWERTFGRGP